MPDAINLGIRLSADGKQLIGEVRRGQKTISSFTQEVRKSGKTASTQSTKLSRFARRMRDVGQESGAATSSMQAFRRIAAVVVSGVTIKALAQTAIEYQRIDRTLQTVFGSTSAARQEFRFIEEQSQRLGLRLATTAKDYAKLAAAAKGTTLEGQQVRDVFIGVNEASTVLGLTAEQTSGALTAIEQIISKGVVSAEELRGQLGERIPGAFQVAARAMGVTTRELGKMLEQGELLAEDLLPKLAGEFRNLYSDDAVKASGEVTGQLNRFRNELDNLARSFGESGFLDEMADAFGDISDALASPQAQEGMRLFGSTVGGVLRFMVEHADKLIAVGGALAFAPIGKFLGGIANRAAGKAVITPGFAGSLGAVGGGIAGLVVSDVGPTQPQPDPLRERLQDAVARTGLLNLTQEDGQDKSNENKNELKRLADAHGRAIASIIARQRELLPTLDQNIAKLNDWRAATFAGLDKTKAGYSKFKDDVERIYSLNLAQIYEDDAERQAEAERKKLERSNLFTDGIRLGIQRFKEDAKSNAEQMADAFGRGFQNMEDALAQFVATGKLDFASFTQSIIADLARIAIRQQITMPLLGFFGDLFNPLPGSPSAAAAASASVGVPGPFSLHVGGIVGSTNTKRQGIPLAEFIGAKHYHAGGIAHNEVPAILQRGEEVLTRRDPRHQLNQGAMPVHVEIINEGTPQQITDAQATVSPEGAVVRIVSEDLASNGNIAQSISNTFGIKRRDH